MYKKVLIGFVIMSFILTTIFMALPVIATPTTAPIIINTTETAKPGEKITVYGEYFESGVTQVRFVGTSTYCSIDYIDPKGQYVTCTIPSNKTAGIFNLEASNSIGWSAFAINAPIPQWSYNNNPWAGQTMKLIGRNFDASEFGATKNTLVSLKNDVTTYSCVTTFVSSYCVDFTVPTCPIQAYTIQVSNDGGTTWVELTNQTSEQTITTRAVGADPLGLGAGWAGDVTWTQYNAQTLYGAVGDGIANDTTAIQRAIDGIKANYGGGVVYLPNGTYRIVGRLLLPYNVSIQGESQTGTIILFDSTDSNVIYPKNDGLSLGGVGVARLTIKVPDTATTYPDMVIRFVGNSAPSIDARTNSKIFVKEVTVDMPIERPIPTTTGRIIPLILTAKNNVIISDNTFKATSAALTSSGCTDGLYLNNNWIEYAYSAVSDPSTHTIIQNNTLVAHPINDTHGFSVRSLVYAYNNTIKNMGNGAVNYNGGEAIMLESPNAGTKMYGAVTSATINTLTVSNTYVNNWVLDDNPWDKWHVLIIDGKGMGQLNQVIALDQTNSIITTKDNWKVTPDSTSKFIVFVPMRYPTLYSNTIQDCSKGLWFYANTYGGIMAKNTITNSEGILFRSGYNQTSNLFSPSYFNKAANNTTTGYSPISKVCAIGVYSGHSGDANVIGNLAYGTVFYNNSITGVLPAPTPVDVSEAPNMNGLYAMKNGSYIQNRTSWEAVLMQNNKLNTLDKGITTDLSGNGLIMDGNTFTNVIYPSNIALGKPTVASSSQTGLGPENAIDGIPMTYWKSTNNSAWIYVDLKETSNISGARLLWGTSYHATSYQIQVSDDAITWNDVYSTTTGDGNLDEIPGLTGSGRYVRLNCTAGPKTSYNLDEFEIYGTPINLALNKTTVASSTQGTYLASKAVDGIIGSRWSSLGSDPSWIYVDLNKVCNITRVKLSWEVAYGKAYQIQVSNDLINWSDIYSTTLGDGCVDNLTNLTGSGRYVRMYGTQRGTGFGYSLYEFEVYGN